MQTVERKAKFLDPLKLEDLGGERWMVDEPLRFYSAKYSRTFKVPQGTITDLASIPTWVQVIGAIIGLVTPFRRRLFSKSGKYNRAAVLHDGAYGDVLVDVNGISLRVSKEMADNLFLEAMLADGVGEREARGMYKAVSIFGNPEKSRKK